MSVWKLIFAIEFWKLEFKVSISFRHQKEMSGKDTGKCAAMPVRANEQYK